MQLPPTIKIGPIHYTIGLKPRTQMVSTSAMGQASSTIPEITLTSDLDDQHFTDTLIHEILHAIYFVLNIHPDDNEERTVTTLATGLTMVMNDNPDLFANLDRFQQSVHNPDPDPDPE